MKCCRLRGTDSGSIRSIPSALYQMFSQEVLVQLSICCWQVLRPGNWESANLCGMLTHTTCRCFSPCSWKFSSHEHKHEFHEFNFWSVKYSLLRWHPAFVKLCGAAFLDFGHSEVNLKSSECCLSQWVVPWLHCSTVNIAKQVIASDAYLALFQRSCSCASLEHHTAHKPLDWAILVKTL